MTPSRTWTIHVVGAGLAGSEAAFRIAEWTDRLSARIFLHEKRPTVMTAAHQTGMFGELVCSNSLKSSKLDSAPGILKDEMRSFGSLILSAAEVARVPAGQALAVDRRIFAEEITSRIRSHPRIEIVGDEVSDLPDAADDHEVWLLATGPLTDGKLAEGLERLAGGQKAFAFYDAIAPIISADSIDLDSAYFADRYGEAGSGDYLNIPLDRLEYEAFVDAVATSEKMPLHDFESTAYFEACLPIEVMVERGKDTLRFGPMKPVGLDDPRSGKRPYAVLQLRKEDVAGSMFSMVGFQTKMTWPEQRRVFAMLPALRNAEFLRFGSVHRNSYLHSPSALSEDLSFKSSTNIFAAGQITGVEGYTESAAIGLLCAESILCRIEGKRFIPPPPSTMLGALHRYVVAGGLGAFQPMNANFGLLAPADPSGKKIRKEERRKLMCARARHDFREWAATNLRDVKLSRLRPAELSSPSSQNPEL